MYAPHLNLLRGFAAISVLIYHIIEHFSWDAWPREGPLIWFRVGWMGVDLFFVLSGFVIALSAYQLRSKSVNYKAFFTRFWVRRIARIVPLYMLTLALFLILIRPELLQLHYWHIVAVHLAFLQSWFEGARGAINGPNWSVSVEMQFYLVMALLTPWLMKMRAHWMLIGGIALAWGLRYALVDMSNYRDWTANELFIFATQWISLCDEFAAGIALAYIYIKHQHLFQTWQTAPWHSVAPWLCLLLFAITLSGTLVIYWNNASYWDVEEMVIFWRSAIAISFTLLMAWLLCLPQHKPQHILYRLGYYLGDISYGIYLWHLMVILLVKKHITEQPEVAALWVIPITLALSIASWHLLEKPAMRFLRRWG